MPDITGCVKLTKNSRCVTGRYGRVDFTWMDSGFIQVVTTVQALPYVNLRLGNIAGSQRILVAFVLLMMLTAAQVVIVGHAVWVKMSEATSWWRMLQVWCRQSLAVM